MKVRNDFVSNSSSCSFIIHIATDDDLNQIKRPEISKVLDKYASEYARDITLLPYGGVNYDNSDSISVGDFIRIYIGEDGDFDWEFNYPDAELIDICDELNKDYNKLPYYSDMDAHVTIGEIYENKK